MRFAHFSYCQFEDPFLLYMEVRVIGCQVARQRIVVPSTFRISYRPLR